MFGDDHLAKMRAQFADQFEPEGPDFLYRKGMRGDAIRVSSAERQAFISTFDRNLRVLFWSFVAALVIMIGALVTYTTVSGVELEESWVYLGVFVLVVAFLLGWSRIWNAPANQIQRRTPVGVGRSRGEVRRMMLSKMGWGEIAALVVLAALFSAKHLPSESSQDIWDWIFLGMGGLSLMAFIFAALAKWRLRP